MDFTFTPTDTATTTKVPYYEDAREDFAPYYRSRKSIRAAQQELAEELTKLDGVVIGIREGFFGNKPRRYGYEIDFLLHGQRGVLRVAGLPMRSETEVKLQGVRVQALLNVRDWLKTAVTQRVFQPLAAHPLMTLLLVDEQHTVGDVLMRQSRIPALGIGPGEVVDGEFTISR